MKNGTLLFLLVGVAPSAFAASPSYGDLAATTTPRALATVVGNLGVLTETVLPNEAKALRKQIGEARDYVDLFSYAYPADHPDLWKHLRKELDEGYETVGAFKDLYDAQGVSDPSQAVYDEALLQARRAAVLNWKQHFGDPDLLDGYTRYVAAPLTDQMAQRKADDLSPYYWGEAKLEPTVKDSGIENLAHLGRALLELARDDFQALRDLRKITKTKNHDQFHSFRKRIRSIAKVARYFPAIFDDGVGPADLLAVLDEVVDRYGALNDKITAFDLARERGDDTKALADEIEEQWDELRAWQETTDVDAVCKKVRHDIQN
jgi:hypothetical protein